MSRRMDYKVIKLECAYGSDRQHIVVNRSQDLTVNDLMQDIHRIYKIPLEELVIFHRGTTISDFPNERLENLGVENNHQIKINHDQTLKYKAAPMSENVNFNQQGSQSYSKFVNTSKPKNYDTYYQYYQNNTKYINPAFHSKGKNQ